MKTRASMWRNQARPGAMQGPLLVIVAGALLGAGHTQAMMATTTLHRLLFRSLMIYHRTHDGEGSLREAEGGRLVA